MKDVIVLGPGKLYFSSMPVPPPPPPEMPEGFSATFKLEDEFAWIELGNLVHSVVLDMAIARPDEEQRRYDKMVRLLFAKDRRQRKRGNRLYNEGF